jgi:hypothetical protein
MTLAWVASVMRGSKKGKERLQVGTQHSSRRFATQLFGHLLLHLAANHIVPFSRALPIFDALLHCHFSHAHFAAEHWASSVCNLAPEYVVVPRT